MLRRTLILFLLAIPLAKGQSLGTEGIVKLADVICGEAVVSGSETTITYKTAKVSPEILDKLKAEYGDLEGVSFDDATMTVSRSERNGIKFDDVAQHNSEVRNCRKQVALTTMSAQ